MPTITMKNGSTINYTGVKNGDVLIGDSYEPEILPPDYQEWLDRLEPTTSQLDESTEALIAETVELDRKYNEHI